MREATREKVDAVIAELNYQPNLAARGLAANRSFLITILYDTYLAHSSYVTNVQLGVLAGCNQAGYEVLIHPIEYNQRSLPAALNQHLKRSRPDGLVLIPPIADIDAVHEQLRAQHIPFACLSPGLKPSVNSVTTNDRQAAKTIGEYLIGSGHKQFALLTGHPDHIAMAERSRGFKDALRAAGMTQKDHLRVYRGDNTFDSGVHACEAILSNPVLPDAIVAGNDEMAAGVINTLHKHGVAIPEQIAVTGFDDAPIARQTWPAITTVKQPVQQMAERAAQLLLDELHGKADQQSISYDCEIVLRDSTRRTPSL